MSLFAKQGGQEKTWISLVFGSIIIVTALNVLLAMIALVREMVSARVLGTTPEADAFFLAYFLPDTIANSVIGGAIGTAALPVFAGLPTTRERPDHSVSFFATWSLIAGGVTAALVVLLAGPAVSLMGGEASAARILFVPLVKITALSLPFYPIAALFIALLQTESSFAIAGTAALLFNVIYTTVLAYSASLSMSPADAGLRQAVVVPIAAIVMLAPLLWDVRRRHVKLSFQLRPDPVATRILRGVAIPLAISATAVVVPFIERISATRIGPGNVASLNYAFKMSQFPVWVLSAAVGTVAFPAIARALSMGRDSLREVLRSSLGAMLLVAGPVGLFMVGMRKEIADFLFSLSAHEAPEVVTLTMAAYSLAIIPQSITILAGKFHLARGTSQKYLYSVIAQSAVGGLISAFVAPVLGLPWLGISWFINNMTAAFILWPDFLIQAQVGWRDLLLPIIASLPMLAAPRIAALVKAPGPAMVSTVLSMAVSGLVCLSATLVVGYFIGLPEVAALKRRFARGFSGVAKQ